MKVLWTSNTLFPELAAHLARPIPVINGWLFALARDLSRSGIELVIATVSNEIPAQSVVLDGITYTILEAQKKITSYDRSLEAQWDELINLEKPDLVHIHGTEYAPALALLRKRPNLKYVLSIQGLISVIERYYLAGLSTREIWASMTLRDVLKSDSILQAQKKFRKRGRELEQVYIKNIKHVIGRTQWDHDHIKTINPSARYHFCNESLRDPFYSSRKWNLSTASRHTIFISQASYPIKGLHIVLKAANLLRSSLPNLEIRVAGLDSTKTNSFRDRLRLNGYGNYLKKMIHQLGLVKTVTFTGPLSENEMVEEYLNAHIFICPSSVENSPNSIGEAQLLGVPCIASYVGGIPDMIEDHKTGLLYRFEEYEMMAMSILQLFNDDQLASNLSLNGISVAEERHNRVRNTARTLEIYDEIVKSQL